MVLNKATFLTEGYTVQVIVIKSYSENKNNIADLTLEHGSPSNKKPTGCKSNIWEKVQVNIYSFILLVLQQTTP